MDDAPRSGRRWDTAVARHRADQQDQILTAAMALLRRKGLAGLTMAAIAEEAGISRPALYHYFADIDAVLAAWVGREVERSVTELVEQASAIADPSDRLDYLVRAQCATFASQDHRMGVEHFESEAVSPVIRSEVSARMGPVRELIGRTLAELEPTVDPELGTDLILGVLSALRRRIISGEHTANAAAEAAISLIRSGLVRSDGPRA
ncbi:MAG: helix-turn-helix domain containing protein [Actinomycetota bacterium]|nr:helix-turn-helix domain containing protein [Actinomycetota bacterium]